MRLFLKWILLSIALCAASASLTFFVLHESQDAKLEHLLTMNNASNKRVYARALLRNGASIHATGNDGTTVLMAAATWYDGELSGDCLSRGVDVNATDANGSTVLIHTAARGGGWNFSHRLIADGANVNAQRNDGNSALMLSATIGDGRVIKTLLEQKADVTLRNAQGETALSLARKHLQFAEDAVRLLEEAGAKE